LTHKEDNLCSIFEFYNTSIITATILDVFKICQALINSKLTDFVVSYSLNFCIFCGPPCMCTVLCTEATFVERRGWGEFRFTSAKWFQRDPRFKNPGKHLKTRICNMHTFNCKAGHQIMKIYQIRIQFIKTTGSGYILW